MKERVHAFESPAITVTWSKRRCIHVAECVRGLPAVFKPGNVPWIEPAKAPADLVAEVVRRCPTGALHYERHDGGAAELVPEVNVVVPDPDGPLYLSGDIEIVAQDGGPVVRDTRIALCRCGATKNRPFCDGSHWNAGVDEAGRLGEGGTPVVGEDVPAGPLKVAVGAGGPLFIEGRFVLASASGDVRCELGGAELCRCGASRNKPFCDGRHTETESREG
jgi:CDGSH-type Zn-finger protein/uncharacterized Fe-S cluster protein YjdI